MEYMSAEFVFYCRKELKYITKQNSLEMKQFFRNNTLTENSTTSKLIALTFKRELFKFNDNLFVRM